jgi:1,4-dihydroxy-2-naphthoyl-CoA synthase
MRTETVQLSITGSTAVVMLNRSEVLNAANVQWMQDLNRAVGELEKVKGLRVVVMAGAGTSFCTGLIRTQKLKQCKLQQARRAFVLCFILSVQNYSERSRTPYCDRMGANRTATEPQSSAHLARFSQLKSCRPSL